jgi:seryl-tRNA synthetase
MINLAWLRQDPEKVFKLVRKKEPQFDIERLYELDAQVRSYLADVELLRKKKNELAELGKRGVTQELRDQSIAISKELKNNEQRLSEVQKEFDLLYLGCPNIPFDDVPEGGKADNVVVKVVGEKPQFNFDIKNHMELGEHLGWLDFEAGSRMAGSQFVMYKGMGAQLVYALTRLMLMNNIKHGYDIMLPPCVTNETSLLVASNFPKFRDQVYAISSDNLYLSPTAEVVLTNLYREHIFADQQLPKRMTAWTSCFRREAGGYGATERGLIRIHQFEKVEIYTICEPEQAALEHERMIACAEDILQQLGLHYRISLLAAQDCSFASAKTYDIEVWLPGQCCYYEVSSSSNCTDFQARRGSIRYKKSGMKKPELVYTLNTSSLAVPRLMVALLETYQHADGTVVLPEVVTKFML